MHEAKSRLSELGELVWQGEKVVIAKAGKPYLDLLPHKPSHKPRKAGRCKGQIKMAADFDTSVPELSDDFES